MLSKAARYKVVFDMQRLQNVTRVAKLNGTSRDTVRHWVKVYHATGDVDTKPGAGRQPCLSDAALDRAYEMLTSGDYCGCGQVAQSLYAEGLAPLVVARTTVARLVKARAEALGKPIHCIRCEPERELSAANKEKRVQFAKDNHATTWATVMFTDRKKFLFKYPGSQKKPCYWVQKGHKPRVKKVTNPMAVNVYAGITKFGITRLHFVAGTSKYKSQHLNMKGQAAKNITRSYQLEIPARQRPLPQCCWRGYQGLEPGSPWHESVSAACLAC